VEGDSSQQQGRKSKSDFASSWSLHRRARVNEKLGGNFGNK
jgi:hypothetical protein